MNSSLAGFDFPIGQASFTLDCTAPDEFTFTWNPHGALVDVVTASTAQNFAVVTFETAASRGAFEWRRLVGLAEICRVVQVQKAILVQ